jgi:assimilatory nitrate reductase catalytic subunit
VQPPPPFAPAPGRFILNTGRVRDHWHTMTRTGKAARLSAHYAEPFVEIHPADAALLNIHRATLVKLSNRHGSAVVRALVTDRQRRGHLFVPMHWTDQFASHGRIDALVSAKVDPISGQPALKMAEVHAEPVHPRLYGFFVAANRPALDTAYWAIAEALGGMRGELAWSAEPADWTAWLRQTFALPKDAEIDTMHDARSGRRNFAVLQDGKLILALYTSPDPVLVSRQWAVDLLAEADLRAGAVLAGRPGADMPDRGAIVCACFSVGANTIASAVTGQGCVTVEAVGACTKAGTNCGSCRAEIRGIIDAHRLAAAE